jgi:hypothetical protein
MGSGSLTTVSVFATKGSGSFNHKRWEALGSELSYRYGPVSNKGRYDIIRMSLNDCIKFEVSRFGPKTSRS